MSRRRKPEPVCAQTSRHPDVPDGYIQWHAWAEQMSKTHVQRRCPGCGRWRIWEPKLTTVRPDKET